MRVLRAIGVVLGMCLLLVCTAFSQQLYITNESHSELQLLNLNTSTLTTIYTIGVGKEFEPDDLTLNAAGQLLYTIPNQGSLNLFDPTTGVNTVLTTGIPGARDLEIEPGGQTILIAGYADPAQIVRFNFSTGAKTVLIKKLGTCDGIAYDEYGNLYAVADHNTIIQVNPSTGAIIATLVLEPHSGVNGGDGMTYDSYTRSIWFTHDGKTGKGVVQLPVSPTGITSTSTYTFYPFTGISSVDGLKSDGKGNLYIGAIFSALEYNIPTNTITRNIVVKGADGVSLIPGTY
jgi:sugar lactone lactonase YvrE